MRLLSRLIRQVLTHTAVLTSVFMFFILILAELIDSKTIPVLSLSTAFICLTAAFLVSVCNLIFRAKSISLFGRTVLHFLACMAAVLLTSTVGSYQFRSSTLLLAVFFAVIYFITVPAYLIIVGSIVRKSREHEDYDSIFDPSTKG